MRKIIIPPTSLVKPIIDTLVPLGEGARGMVATWGLMAKGLMKVAPLYFRLIDGLIHLATALSIIGHLYFMVQIARGHASSGLIVFAYYWLSVPLGVYGDWSDPLYQLATAKQAELARQEALPSPDAPEQIAWKRVLSSLGPDKWRNLTIGAFTISVVGTPIGICSALLGKHFGTALASLFGVTGVVTATLIQFVSVAFSALTGTLTITYLVSRASRPATVTGGENLYRIMANWIWRSLVYWWAVPLWQGAVLVGSASLWVGSADLRVEPADLARAAAPAGYTNPVGKRLRDELTRLAHGELAIEARAAVSTRQIGLSIGLLILLLGELLWRMLLQWPCKACIGLARWPFPKDEDPEVQSLMRGVRMRVVRGVPLWLLSVVLAAVAPGMFSSIPWLSVPVFAALINQGVKDPAELLSALVRYVAREGHWPTTREHWIEVYKIAADLQRTVKFDCWGNILLSYLFASLVFNVCLGNRDPFAFQAFLPFPAIFFSGPISAWTGSIVKGLGHRPKEA